MINSQRIEIATIKDLKGIFFYYVGSGLDKKISGLSIVYGDNRKLDYDYTYRYYKDYVRQVLKVYQKEKKNNNIILYDDLTKEVVNSYDFSKIRISNDEDIFTENKINLLSIPNILIKDIEEYLKKIVLSIMEIVTGDNKSVIDSIIGCNNKYMISCTTSDGKVIQVPFQCIKKEGNYYFKMYFPDIDLLKIIDGYIEIDEDRVIVNWNDYNNGLSGRYNYSANPDECTEVIINDSDEILYYGDELEELNEEKKEMLLGYSDLIGIKNCKINQIGIDSYVLSEDVNRKKEDNVFYKRKVGYVTLKKDYASVIYIYTQGVIKYDGVLNVPFMKEQREIKFIPFDIDDEHYILKEIVCDFTDKMSGEYQEGLNKYCYYVLKVEQNNDLRLPITILSEERLDRIDINNLLKVKRYLRSRKEGL